jgi:hypothetical protein
MFDQDDDDYIPWRSRFMVDLDFRWLDLPDFLGALDFEVWWLELTDTPVGNGIDVIDYQDSQAYGGVAQFNFATPMKSLSVSLGYEVIWEENGIVFGVDPNTADLVPDGIPVRNQTRQSVEVTPIWAIGDHVIVDLSWRSDWSNKDVFTNSDGNPTDFAWLIAWEWYYYF